MLRASSWRRRGGLWRRLSLLPFVVYLEQHLGLEGLKGNPHQPSVGLDGFEGHGLEQLTARSARPDVHVPDQEVLELLRNPGEFIIGIVLLVEDVAGNASFGEPLVVLGGRPPAVGNPRVEERAGATDQILD